MPATLLFLPVFDLSEAFRNQTSQCVPGTHLKQVIRNCTWTERGKWAEWAYLRYPCAGVRGVSIMSVRRHSALAVAERRAECTASPRHAGARRVPAAAARRAQSRASRAPHAATPQQVPEENCKRAGAQPHARDQPRLRSFATSGARSRRHGDTSTLREADQNHDSTARDEVHHGSIFCVTGTQLRFGVAAGEMVVAAVLGVVRVLRGAGPGNSVGIRWGFAISLWLVLRGVWQRLHR